MKPLEWCRVGDIICNNLAKFLGKFQFPYYPRKASRVLLITYCVLLDCE